MIDGQIRGLGVTLTLRRSLDRVVIRACGNCGAPGVYHPHESILNQWPACYVPKGSPYEGRPVGDSCPHCHSPRAPDEVLPEIVFEEGSF